MERERVISAVQNADMMLVGIGEEFFADAWLQEDTEYQRVSRTVAEQDMQWVMPYVQAYFMKKSEAVEEAYSSLEKLLNGKNYFVLTVCTDGRIRQTKLKQDRIVEPCGSFHMMQCGKGCAGSVVPTGEAFLKQVEDCIQGVTAWNMLKQPECAQCGAALEFNSLYAEHYLEEGYAESWQTYTKWLQGTLNRRLCILELGAGMMFAGVTRFRFEKIAALNRKVDFIRIHNSLSNIPEDIAGRGHGIAQNAVEFMRSLW